MSTMLRYYTAVLGLAASALAQYTFSSVSEHCLDLFDFVGDSQKEAPTNVHYVSYIAANGTVPALCKVNGVIDQNIGFEIKLPADGSAWAGVWSQMGCEGTCGEIIDSIAIGAIPWDVDQLQRGWTSAVNDMGHTNLDISNILDFYFLRNNRPQQINYGHRATHLLTVAGKAMLKFYYGVKPEHSYFRGVSTGGRQAMIAAQRYPTDFDGIISQSVDVNETALFLNYAWVYTKGMHPNGTSKFSADDLQTLQNASRAACDGDDGLVDGIVDPSFLCSFDPAALLCDDSSGDGGCLSQLQVEAAQAIYAGPTDSQGHRITNLGVYPGFETDWIYNFLSTDPYAWYITVLTGLTSYLFEDSLPLQDYDVFAFDWDNVPSVLNADSILSPNRADMSLFKANGGKLLIQIGWQDYGSCPEAFISWYKRLRTTMGGQDEVDDFVRGFLVPGYGHIVGPGCGRVDNFYDILEDWVLNDVNPVYIVGGHYSGGDYDSSGTTLEFSRRLYSWPYTSKLIPGANATLPESWERYGPLNESAFAR
ncbi:tannase precursor [Ophiostoma piceae UAMH 11346]|uniref:Carboxylic ester hydrolase n=1 Tax=Ophiostoma piceae (strain UAMH 11346) TaxID=1262450 RepID=S3C2C3_OPHP1|nr:tannase precursor [Ophiostoma piceae UAMH 11346]